MSNIPKKNIVVIGNGMVGHRFVENLIAFDELKEYQIVTFAKSRERPTTASVCLRSSRIATPRNS